VIPRGIVYTDNSTGTSHIAFYRESRPSPAGILVHHQQQPGSSLNQSSQRTITTTPTR
jgi:hypothetical protein